MKKSDIGLIIGVLAIIIISAFVSVGKPMEKVYLTSSISSTENENYDEEDNELISEGKYDSYISIDYDEYKELLKKEDYFFITIGRTGCSYCEKYKPVLETVATDLNLPLHYIDIADLDDEELEEFSTSNEFLKSNEWGTPTTLLLNKDEILASHQGYIDEEELKEFIEKYVNLDGEE